MKIRNRWLVLFAAWLASRPFILLARLVKFEVICKAADTVVTNPHSTRQCLFSLWHDQILSPLLLCQQPLYRNRRHRVSSLVSRHQDGSILTDFMSFLNINSVRGSSSKGGTQALRQLMSEAAGSSIFITPDGPRGPRRQLKDGIIFISSRAGIPILPVGTACSASWNLQGNWTNLVIPRPFCRLTFHMGEPIQVPPDADRETIELYRKKLEHAMEFAEAQATRMLTISEARIDSGSGEPIVPVWSRRAA